MGDATETGLAQGQSRNALASNAQHCGHPVVLVGAEPQGIPANARDRSRSRSYTTMPWMWLRRSAAGSGDPELGLVAGVWSAVELLV